MRFLCLRYRISGEWKSGVANPAQDTILPHKAAELLVIG